MNKMSDASDMDMEAGIRGEHYDTSSRDQWWDYCGEYSVNFLLGNIVKYVIRSDKKDGVVDLRKANTYLNQHWVYYKVFTRYGNPTTIKQFIEINNIKCPLIIRFIQVATGNDLVCTKRDKPSYALLDGLLKSLIHNALVKHQKDDNMYVDTDTETKTFHRYRDEVSVKVLTKK